VLAIQAFFEGDYAKVVRLLLPIRSDVHRFGDSHAQRNFIGLTLIEVGCVSGQDRLAQQAQVKGEPLKKEKAA